MVPNSYRSLIVPPSPSCKEMKTTHSFTFLTFTLLLTKGMAFINSFSKCGILPRVSFSKPLDYSLFKKKTPNSLLGKGRMASVPSSTLPEYEVEQKFALTSVENIETRLRDLGFVPSTSTPEIEMVDWYWDDATDQWQLTTQDNWLRFRHVTDKPGEWQLKLRRRIPSETKEEQSVVYEEIVGTEAITAAVSKLSLEENNGINVKNDTLYKDFLHEHANDLPKEMTQNDGTPQMTPFAKIVTRRSTWIPSKDEQQTFQDIKVDLDATNFDYAVGEVEVVVHDETEIADAQQRVNQFVVQLTQEPEMAKPPVGKLEYYLMQNRPDHYQALLDREILK